MRRWLLALLALLAGTADARADAFGSTAPFGGNLTAATGYQQNGSTILNQQTGAQASLWVGSGAGASLPANSIFSTFVGWNAGNKFTGATGEATCIGTIACPLLVSGNFDTAVGEHAMGMEVSASSSTAIGNDAQRDYVSTGSNTSVGKDAQYGGGGAGNTAVGAFALRGNASVVTIGGTATASDVITLTFTGTFTGSPQSQAITVTGGQTTTQMATAMAAAINANAAIFGQALISTSVLTSGAQLQFQWPGTATTGSAIIITSSVSGSATETIAVTGGATGNDNVALGNSAMKGDYSLTTATGNVAVGKSTMPNLSSGTTNVAVGAQAGLALTTGSNSVLVGNNAGLNVTTQSGIVAIGGSALSLLTTGASNTAVGFQAGQNHTGLGSTFVGNNAGLNVTSGNNNTVLGSTALQGAAASTAQLDVAIGDAALQVVTSGQQNIAIGHNTGNKVTNGSNNTLIGVGVASTTLTTGGSNILIGTSSAIDTPASGTSSWLNIGGAIRATLTAPTASSGFGTSPTIPAGTTSAGFQVNVGTGGAASSGVITFPVAAPNGWACNAVDGTNAATSNTVATPTSTTTMTLTNYSRTTGALTAWAASDVITVSCNGF